MSQRECGNCAREVPDGAGICMHCTTALAQTLRRVPGLLDDLVVTWSKQDRLRAGGGHRTKQSEAPLPVRFDITAVIAALGNELTTWARDLVDRHGWDVPDPPRRRPHNTAKPDIPSVGAQNLRRGEVGNGRGLAVFPTSSPSTDLACYAAVWLADHIGQLRMHPAVMEAHRGITSAITVAENAIDRPVPWVYRGPCEKCEAELHAAPNATTVVCGGCGEAHDGAVLRQRLLDKAADQLVTTVELSAALTGLSGMSVAIGTIRSWRSRGQLAPHAWLHEDRVVLARPVDHRDKPLFRVGEAAELLKKLRAS